MKNKWTKWVKWGMLVLTIAVTLTALTACEWFNAPETPDDDFPVQDGSENTIPETDPALFTFGAVSGGYEITSYIGQEATVKIPSSYQGKPVVSIGANAFEGCTSLTELIFGDNSPLITIGSSAFRDCTALVSVTLGENSLLRSVGEYAFYNCSNLTHITLPNSLTCMPSIGDNAFGYCDNVQFNNYDHGKYLGNESNPYLCLAFVTDRSITECKIHENTKIIFAAFSRCEYLESITIPDRATLPSLHPQNYYCTL